MVSLAGYLGNPKRSPKPFPLKPEEKILLFPHVSDITTFESQTIEQMLETFVLEAIFKKEITKTSSTRDVTNLLTTVFMGGIVTAHAHQSSSIKLYFRKNVDIIMRGL
jgi:hypothetical protein